MFDVGSNVLSLLGVLPGGGILGFLASLGSRWFESYLKRKDREQEMKLLELRGKLAADERKAVVEAERQRFDALSFLESIRAQSGLVPVSKWSRDLLPWFRPLLTLLVVVIPLFVVTPETRDFLVQSYASLGGYALGFWFGRRSLEKMAVMES